MVGGRGKGKKAKMAGEGGQKEEAGDIYIERAKGF